MRARRTKKPQERAPESESTGGRNAGAVICRRKWSIQVDFFWKEKLDRNLKGSEGCGKLVCLEAHVAKFLK